jgi:Ca2+-binding RTX toxin-like protein
MAVIQLSMPVDMTSASVWFGQLVAYDANHIVIENGPFKGVYTGSFTYPGDGNVYGTLTGYTFSIGGATVGNISGLNVSANLAEQWIESNNLQPLFQAALAGNDQFYPTAGAHTLNGEGGYNTVYEAGGFVSYQLTSSGSATLVNGNGSADTLYNVQGIYFGDGFYDILNGTFTRNGQPATGFAAADLATGTAPTTAPQSYSGPVAGLQNEFVQITPDNLNVSVTSDNWLVHTGSGTDGIAVRGGTNVLDGGTGSNFLVGGNGFDTFFVDDRAAADDIWSTVVNFHGSDAATIWGVTPQDFNLAWADNQGAAGFTGLTLHAMSAGRATASLTLAGYTTADLSNGRLTISFGSDPTSGSSYMYVHGN